MTSRLWNLNFLPLLQLVALMSYRSLLPSSFPLVILSFPLPTFVIVSCLCLSFAVFSRQKSTFHRVLWFRATSPQWHLSLLPNSPCTLLAIVFNNRKSVKTSECVTQKKDPRSRRKPGVRVIWPSANNCFPAQIHNIYVSVLLHFPESERKRKGGFFRLKLACGLFPFHKSSFFFFISYFLFSRLFRVRLLLALFFFLSSTSFS